MFIIAGIMSEEEVPDYARMTEEGVTLFDLLRPMLTADTAAEIDAYFNNPEHNVEVYKVVKSYLENDVRRLLYARELLSRNVPDLVNNTTIADMPGEMLDGERNITGVPLDERIRIFQEILSNRGKLDFVTLPGTKDDWEKFWKAVKNTSTLINKERLYANRIKLYNKSVKPTANGITTIISKMADLEMLCKGYVYLKKMPGKDVAMFSKIYTDLNSVLTGGE